AADDRAGDVRADHGPARTHRHRPEDGRCHHQPRADDGLGVLRGHEDEGPVADGGGRQDVAMDFGIFMEFEIRQGGDQASAFREGFDLVDSAEAWGLDGVWLGEMHFTPARSVLAAPIVVASSIATRTKRLRIGLAVQGLPLNNPLRIAEEAATVDHISEGRFDFGIGRSGFPRVYDMYGIPYAESQARFREALEIILPAWKGEPFSSTGQYYRFENATVAPRPYPLPHPPLPTAAPTEGPSPRVARRGLPISVGRRGMDIRDRRIHVQAYRKAWRDAGHAG